MPESAQQFASPAGSIAVSPDGVTVAYISASGYVCLFTVGWPYGYSGPYARGQTTGIYGVGTILNSLQFTSDTDIYHISNFIIGGEPYINHLKYQEAYCLNQALSAYPS